MKQKDKKHKCVLVYPLEQGGIVTSEVVPGQEGGEESRRLAEDIMKILKSGVESEVLLEKLTNCQTPLILVSKKSGPPVENKSKYGIGDLSVRINTVYSTARRSNRNDYPERRVPFIEFGGAWLEKAGFKTGMKFAIYPGKDHLVLKTIDNPGQTRRG